MSSLTVVCQLWEEGQFSLHLNKEDCLFFREQNQNHQLNPQGESYLCMVEGEIVTILCLSFSKKGIWGEGNIPPKSED